MAADQAETAAKSPGRRGRPRSGEREQRRSAVLAAAADELIESGYEGLTMLKIAKRAGASKETLYSWFGNRQGLLSAMIADNGDAAAERVQVALSGGHDHIETLTAFCGGLLRLLTGPHSVALNRAAMGSPELAGLLLQSGRHRVGPIVEKYLGTLAAEGTITIEDPGRAFNLLYGLAIQDTQIRVLLGEQPPPPEQLQRQAEEAVTAFLALTGSAGRWPTRSQSDLTGPPR